MVIQVVCAVRLGFGNKSMNLQSRYDFGHALVQEAGALALAYFQKLDELTIKSKGPQDVVSEADVNVEHLIKAKLKATFPDDGFLGEETGRDALSNTDCLWVVDPIDGTQPFVSGMSSWCVSIALVYKGAVAMGFVYAPARQELFVGFAGKASLNSKPIQVRDVSSVKNGITAIGYSPRSAPDIFLPFFGAIIKAGGTFAREGSGALALCYVACGRLIGYAELHINSWDCLGALAVVYAAGGISNDYLKGESLWNGNSLIAGHPHLFPQLQALTGIQ
jgi:myo-inositol-1(or 4)-monophosphatase